MQISLSILPGSVMYGRWILMLVVVVVCTSGPLRAQAGVFYRLETIGSDADDRARLAQLLGERRSHGYLLRSPSRPFVGVDMEFPQRRAGSLPLGGRGS